MKLGERAWVQGVRNCELKSILFFDVDRAQEVYLDHKSRLDGASEPARKRRRISQRRQAVRVTSCLDPAEVFMLDVEPQQGHISQLSVSIFQTVAFWPA